MTSSWDDSCERYYMFYRKENPQEEEKPSYSDSIVTSTPKRLHGFFLLICQDCKKFIDNRLNLINSKIIYCFLRIISVIMYFRNYLILRSNIVFVEIFRRNLFIVVFEFDHDVINHDINDWLIWLINNVCSRKRKREVEIAFRVIARDKFSE